MRPPWLRTIPCETESASPVPLPTEEGGEDTRQHLGRDTAAVIGHLNPRFAVFDTEADNDFAAMRGHGVAGIDQESRSPIPGSTAWSSRPAPALQTRPAPFAGGHAAHAGIFI
jgi:hypothetical protein